MKTAFGMYLVLFCGVLLLLLKVDRDVSDSEVHRRIYWVSERSFSRGLKQMKSHSMEQSRRV